jgi:hypothetical protein
MKSRAAAANPAESRPLYKGHRENMGREWGIEKESQGDT